MSKKKDKAKGNQNIKAALTSIVIGACVAFLATLFDGLVDFIRLHGEDLVAGAISSAIYLAKQYRG